MGNPDFFLLTLDLHLWLITLTNAVHLPCNRPSLRSKLAVRHTSSVRPPAISSSISNRKCVMALIGSTAVTWLSCRLVFTYRRACVHFVCLYCDTMDPSVQQIAFNTFTVRVIFEGFSLLLLICCVSFNESCPMYPCLTTLIEWQLNWPRPTWKTDQWRQEWFPV